MAARLDLKPVAALPLNFNVDLEIANTTKPLGSAAGLSTLTQAQTLECACEIANEKLGVSAALGRANFDNPFHLRLASRMPSLDSDGGMNGAA